MLKVRSVTQRKTSAAIARDARAELARAGVRVTEESPLAPFSRDHVAMILRR
jgi:fibrillarin-like rRNA methylase